MSLTGTTVANPMTPLQLRRYQALAEAIRGSARPVGCVEHPDLFDRSRTPRSRRQLKARSLFCQECPVLDDCRLYLATGVEVGGYAAGRSR